MKIQQHIWEPRTLHCNLGIVSFKVRATIYMHYWLRYPMKTTIQTPSCA